jgi:hypothetical protein
VKVTLLMPGEGCRFWAAGRCLYEESVNPGLRREFACVVLAALEDRFDDFLTRSEILGLSGEQAGQIWERRMAQALNIGWDCANFTALQDDAGEALCLHFMEGVCLLRMPRCPGRCRRYKLSRETVSEQGDGYE